MKYEFLEKLQKQIEEILKTKDRVLISVIGKGGTGKSYFGKYLRNHGIGQHNRRAILVIDDGIMWVEFLYFFRRRVRLKYRGSDELDPVLANLSERKKVIFYINATPWKKISEADILLKLSTDEITRRKRLHNRYKNGSKTLKKALDSKDTNNGSIAYKYFIEGKS